MNSENAQRAIYSSATGEAFITLLEITHPDLSEPIRVCDDGVDTMHEGQVFIFCPFGFTHPDSKENEIPRAQLRIENVSRKIVQAVRSVTGAPTVIVKVVLASSPDVVEFGPLEFKLLDTGWDALVVQGNLGFEEGILNKVYPADAVTPQTVPGSFR